MQVSYAAVYCACPQSSLPGKPAGYCAFATMLQVGQPEFPAHVPVTFLIIATDDRFHVPPNKFFVPGVEDGLPKMTNPSLPAGIVPRGESPHPSPLLSINVERKPPKLAKQQLLPGRGLATLLRKVTLSNPAPIDHNAKQSSPVCLQGCVTSSV
jgi:hypothetical protein